MCSLLAVVYASPVGKIGVVSGKVNIMRGDSKQVAKNNMPLENKDIIETSKDSTAQLVFLDNSVATIGPNTTFDLKSYPIGTDEGADLQVSKGIFKFMTGNMSKLAKQNFKLQTKTTTMGIRGTHLIVKSDDENDIFVCLSGEIKVKHNNKNIDEHSVPAGYSIQASQAGYNKVEKTDIEFLKTLNQQFRNNALSDNSTPIVVSDLSQYFDKKSIDDTKQSATFLTESNSDVSVIFDAMSNKKGMVGAVVSTMSTQNSTNGYIAITPVSDDESIGYLNFYEPMLQIFPATSGQNYTTQSAIYSSSFIPNNAIASQVNIDTQTLNLPYNTLYSNASSNGYLYYDNLKQFYSWNIEKQLQNNAIYSEIGFAGKQSALSLLPANQFLFYKNIIDQNIISSYNSGVSITDNINSTAKGVIVNTLNNNVLVTSLSGNINYGARLYADQNNNAIFSYIYNGNNNQSITAQGKFYGDYYQGIGMLNTYLKDNDDIFSQVVASYRGNLSLPFVPATPETGTASFDGYTFSWRSDLNSNITTSMISNPISWTINKNTGAITGTIRCKDNSVDCQLDGDKSSYISANAYKAQAANNDATVNIYTQFQNTDEYDAYLSAGVYFSTDNSGIENGVFIAGERTPTDVINSLIANNRVFDYSGYVDGYIHNSSSNTMDYINAQQSTINARIDFGSANPISGNMNIVSFGADDGISKQISANLVASGSSITPSSSSFASSITQGTGASNTSSISGSLNGKLYGPQATSIGGGFTINGQNTNLQNIQAFGIFKGQKQ